MVLVLLRNSGGSMKRLKIFGAIGLLLAATAAYATTYTTNKGYPQPTVGGSANQWGTLLNQQSSIIDANMGGEASVSVAGSSDVTATSTQAQNLVQLLTGALTGNISYILPAAGGFYIINNQTSGAYTVTVITSAGASTGTIVPQGQSMMVWSDGTNIYPANGTQATPTAAPPVGSGMQYWGSSAPAGWIFAYGQSLGQSTCSQLYAVIGQTYGTGAGGSTFSAPDMRGRVAIALDNLGGTAANRITSAVSGITGTTLGATGGSQNAQADTITLNGSVTASSASSATSTVNDPGHSHTMFDQSGGGQGNYSTRFYNNGIASNTGGAKGTDTATTGITVGTTVTTTTTITNTLSASSGLTGASQNVQPGIMSNYIIYAGGACS